MPKLLLTAALILATSLPSFAQGWSLGQSRPAPRQEHAAAWDDGRGVMVVLGGGCGVSRADLWEFDGTTWTHGPQPPAALTPRQGHAMAWDSSRGRTVVFGGDDGALQNDTWEYDGTQWIQGPVAPAPLTARQGHMMAYDAKRRLTVLFGGTDASGDLNDTWEYDGAQWRPGGAPHPLLTPRRSGAMAWDPGSETVLMVGGRGLTLLADVWTYDGTWSLGIALPGLFQARRGHAMAFDPSRNGIVVFGGSRQFAGIDLLNDVWLFDGVSWTQLPSPPFDLTARMGHTMVSGPGPMVFAGLDGDLQNDTWLLDSGGWSEVGPDMPSARALGAAAYDSTRNRLVLFGGDDGNPQNDTWEYDGNQWAQGPAAPFQLTPRAGHAVAFDAQRGVTVLFGGNDGNLQGDTWEYDGSQWTLGGPPNGLTPRQGHVMAWDSVRGQTVLFGGDDGSLQNDTWEYDGGQWTQGAPPTAGLTPRQGHVMAWDAHRQVMVMFGGNDGARRNDTWEYDGGQWTQGPPPSAGLTPRQGHVMAWDSLTGRMVLLGGDDGGRRNDTWEYDGSQWVGGVAAPAELTPRQGHVMAWDSLAGRMVLFAGNDGCLLDDTWEYEGVARSHVLAGAGFGDANPNRLRSYDGSGSPGRLDFDAYATGTWGLHVGRANLDLGPFDAVLTGPGPGPQHGPQVRAFDRDGAGLAKVNFYAYGTLRYGVVADGVDVDSDAYHEILTTPGGGAVFGPHVRAFDVDGAQVRPKAKINFFAYATLAWGARVTGGDLEADGFEELLVGPGPGPTFGSQVRGFDFDGQSLGPIAKLNFQAFSAVGYGAIVAEGDVDGDGFSEVLPGMGPGPGHPARLSGYDFDGVGINRISGLDAVVFPSSYGLRPATGEILDDPGIEILASPGPDPGADSTVGLLSWDGTTLNTPTAGFEAFTGWTHGVNLAAGFTGL